MTSPQESSEPTKARFVTPRTYGLGVLGIICLGLALVTGYVALAICGFGFLLVIGLGLLLVGRPPGGLMSRSVAPDQITRGDEAVVTLSSRNRALTPSAPMQAVDRVAGTEVELIVPGAGPRQTATVEYSFRALRRGEIDLGPVVLERIDPWGLYRRQGRLSDITTLLVHPRIHPLDLRLGGHRQGLEGGQADRDMLGSNQFSTLREYVVGDELRQVHWKSSARVGKLMVKQLVDNPLPRALVIIDTDISTYPPAQQTSDGLVDFTEEAVDVAASIAAALVEAGLPATVRASTTDDSVEVLRAEDIPRMLDMLALVEVGQPSRAPVPLRPMVLAARATSLYLVTGSLSPRVGDMLDAAGLVGSSRMVRMGAQGPGASPRTGFTIVDARLAADLAMPGPPAGSRPTTGSGSTPAAEAREPVRSSDMGADGVPV